MPDMGVLRIGKTAKVELQLDHTAGGEARLLLAYGRTNGSPPSDQSTTVAPGGSDSLSQALDARGRLEVGVSIGATDTGTLEVTENGTVKDRQKITGPTNWVYVVLAPPAASGGGGS